MEEPETRENSPPDSPAGGNRPFGEKDISHIFASIFKDLYKEDIIGKDTLSNLIKTKGGRSSHVKYVEELQQVHSEYNRCVKEADMLESHIIQARARAASQERLAYERMKGKTGDFDDHLGLITVKSAFSWCVDSDLLEAHNLISPRDYITTQKPRVGPPAAIKSNPAKPTIAYSTRVTKEPQDDGFTPIPSPAKAALKMNELDDSLTFESSSDGPKRKNTPGEKPTQAKPRSKWTWKGEASAKDKAEATEKLSRLKGRHAGLRNPHFLPPQAQHGSMSLIQPRTRGAEREHERKGMGEQSLTDDPAPVFLAKPPVVVFTDYSVGHVYETTLELQNVTSSSRHVRVIPPTTPYFSLGLGRFPSEGGVVAPGMSCKYTVRFAPDSLADCEDFVVVETQAEQLLVVPVAAARPPPILTLPRVLDCGYCLIGGVKFVEFLCQNVGLSAGTFCIIPKSQWPVSNLRHVARTYFSEQPPFAISPSLFVLQPGEATKVEVVFFPTAAEKSCQVFTVVCDNCQVKDVSIEGEGQSIALELASVSGEKDLLLIGEVRDLTAEHFVRFSSCNPHSVQQKKLVIRNNVHLELPFHWQILKPNLQPLLPGETPLPSKIQFHLATDDAFHVSPPTGLLAPCQDQEFLLTFCPKELKDYHSVCHLVLRDVPQPPPRPSENSLLQPVRLGSKVSDVIAMEIEAKGSTEPYQILLEPYAVVIPGEIYISTTTRKHFKMWNHSRTFISFQWERMDSSIHIIEVEPSTGRIEENECFDLNLIVTGGKPEKVVTSLVCHIEHRHEPITLTVEVSFKGPTVTVSVPSVDFGLMRLGQQTQTTLLLANNTRLEASWTIEDSQWQRHDTPISVEPRRGVLPPLASCSVDLFFRPRFCLQFETDLELAVENGTGCHLSVRADVHSPRVCLLNCELLLSELYVDVPAEASVTLFNQTLLPSHFKWRAQLQGEQAALCTATFDPSSGTLGPNASIEIAVTFTSHADLELTEVAALCEVQGMDSHLVLGIVAPEAKRLSVSYSLPSVGSAAPEKSHSPPVLDFGGDVVLKTAVTRQLLITNHTAVPAPFAVEAEYFTCHASKPNDQSENRYVKKPLHAVQAKKVEEKAYKEFVSSLLAHGKGAAFFVLPNTGTLGPFETRTLDVTAYTDMWGEYTDNLICKAGELEPTLIPVQMAAHGCPLYFQMTGPRPHEQNLGPIIQFGTHVSGGDTVSRSVRINNPTMSDIRIDWETYNADRDDSKLVDVVVAYGDAFPIKDADGNEVMSGAMLLSDENSRTAHDRTCTPDSQGAGQTEMEEEEEEEEEEEDRADDEKETSLHPFPENKKLFSVFIRPHVGISSDYPYCVTPQQIVIPAKGSGTIHVSFTPLTLSGAARQSRCAGFALGFMSLDSKMAACVQGKVVRAQGLDLEPLRVDLQSAVMPALLSVQMEDDGGALLFHASAGDLLRAESQKELAVREFDVMRSLQLTNTSEMPIHFRLGTRPPFTVLQPQPRARTSASGSSPAGDSESLVLQPRKSMQVKVAFHCSPPLLDHVQQTDEEVAAGVTLIHDASGMRRLRFQHDLLIRYSNSGLQTVPLCAHLDLPTLRLSSPDFDFGSCYVGQVQTREVNLYGCGAHTYWKSVIESDEGDAPTFRVAPDSGLLRSPELRVASCSQILCISFTPSEDREFRATVVIRSPLVKTPLTLQLQGAGSFDEGYKS